MDNNAQQEIPSNPLEESNVIFVGSGSSTGTPRLGCLMRRPITCKVCVDALKPQSRNRRRNPSILIQYKNKNILIDCGKSFREAFIELMTRHHIEKIDAVVITHGHADAFLGLDDLREFCWEQTCTDKNAAPIATASSESPKKLADEPLSRPPRASSKGVVIPIYSRASDFPRIKDTFPYLVDSNKATGSGFVSQLEFVTFTEDPFVVLGLTFTPFKLHHGHNSTCAGFRFGNVVYLSDISGMSNRTREKISMSGPIDILIIDALNPTERNRSHYSLQEAIAEAMQLKAKKVYFVGMSHSFDYEGMNQYLRTKHPELDAELAYDCLKIKAML